MPRPPKIPGTPRELSRNGGRSRNLERRYIKQNIATSNYSNAVINDPAGGLVLYWKLDELGDTTTDAVDSSGNEHTGTYGTSPHHPTLGVAALADGTAASFDGGDLVRIGSHVDGIQGFGVMSIEFWVKTTQTSSSDPDKFGTPGNPAIVASDTNTAGGRFFKVRLNLPTGEVDFRIFGSDGSQHALLGSTPINDGARHYVVCTFDGTDMNIYVDGVLDATGTPSMGGFPLANDNSGFWVGSGSEIGGGFVEDDHVVATIDEVALYTVALPLSSIETHYLIGGTAANPPSGTAGGVLSGSYPDPDFNPSVAGSGLGIDGANDVLSVNVDGTTIEISSDALRLKDTGPGAIGPIGDATHVAAVTINAKGQVTGLTAIALAPSDVSVPTPAATTTGDGIKRDFTAGETLAFGDPVYIKSDGKVWKGDADTAGTFPVIGMAMGSAAANAAVTVLLLGVARNDSWAWTVGGIVYLSTSSGLTQTQPSATDNAIQIIGIAEAATRIYVNPQLVWITHT